MSGNSKKETGWEWFKSHFLPATKQDLDAMENRLMDAINKSNEAVLKELTKELSEATDSLDVSVKSNQPGK